MLYNFLLAMVLILGVLKLQVHPGGQGAGVLHEEAPEEEGQGCHSLGGRAACYLLDFHSCCVHVVYVCRHTEHHVL